MKMQKWLNARCHQLLMEINDTPFTDNVDEIKLQMIMTAMREASVEMFHRAAENSRKEIERINNQALEEAISDVEDKMTEEDVPQTPEQTEEKIKLTSSVIRRVDSF